MSTAYLRGVAWAEQTLTPLAERIIATIEDPPEQPLAPKTPARDLESELLQGGHSTLRSCAATRTPTSSSAPAEFVTKAEAQELRADCDALLQQRERLRAQLIAEQERRERAEAELVAVGAQWLGTETQEALRQRAELEKKRELQLARTAIQREADQRVAKLEAERTMLLERLGEKAPSAAQLRMQLRAALQQELEQAQREAREAVRAHLNAAYEERSRLRTALSAAEAMHRLEVEALRASLRKASELMQEQYDKGFVMGLKEAASALAPATSRARAERVAAASPSAPTTAPAMTFTITLFGCINGVGVGLDASNLVNMLAKGSPAAASELRMGDKVVLWNGVAMVDPVCGRQRKLKEVVVRSDVHTLVVERAGAAARSDAASAGQEGVATAAAEARSTPEIFPEISPAISPQRTPEIGLVDKAEYRRMKEALVERLEAERAEKARQVEKALEAEKALEDDKGAGKALEDERDDLGNLVDDLGNLVEPLEDDGGGGRAEEDEELDLGDDLCPIHQGEAEAEEAPPQVAPPQGALLAGLKVRAAA